MEKYNFKPPGMGSGYDTQTDEEVFDMANSMLMFACMHLLDGQPNLDAMRKLRYAQRELISEWRLKQIEDALDRKQKQKPFSSIQFGSGLVFSAPCGGTVTSASTYQPITLEDVTVTIGKP